MGVDVLMVLNINQGKNMMMMDPDVGTRPEAPGSAYIWNNKQGEWIKPPQPNDPTMDYTWDDDRGWTGTPKTIQTPGGGGNTGPATTYTASDGKVFTNEAAYATYQASLNTSASALGAANITAAATNAAAAAASAASALAAQQAAIQGQKQNAIQFLTATFNDLGLGGDIADAVTELVQQGYSADTIQMIAQDPKSSNPLAVAFKARFPANAARLDAGLPVLSPAEYLATERSYAQVLQSYGLPSGFAQNKDVFTKLLTSDVSPTELNSRVSTAKQVIDNTDPMVTQQLQQYYGLSQGDMIAHVLDPSIATPIIQKQITASQIGAESARAGVNVNQSYAEQLGSMGISQAQASTGFQNIAQSQQGMQELATRYNAYGPAGQIGSQLEAATFGTTGAAAAQEELNRLKQQEVSQFSGSSGAGKGSLMGTEAGLS